MAPSTRVLGSAPALGPLFGKAAAASLAKRRPSERRLPAVSADAEALVPPARFALRGVTADLGRLTRFQHLVGEPAADVLPAVFVHVLGFPLALKVMTDSDFPLPPLGMIHTANRVRVHRLPRIDEPLELTAFTRSLRPHRRGTVAEVAVTASSGGEMLLDESSEYLAKGIHLFSGSSQAQSGHEAFSPPHQVAQWRFAQADVSEYAKLSGDANPIHTNRVAARVFGFPRTIAHGMYAAARALAYQEPGTSDWQWEVRFASPIRLPSTAAVGLSRTGSGSLLTAWNPRSGNPHLWSEITPPAG